MTDLRGYALTDHLRLVNTEYKFNKSIYGYPDKNIFRGIKDYDFNASLYGKPVYTPLGPAAGPHTQLAQNIVVGFLAGARVFELKTIQVMDDIQISRPCIDIRNVGYNVEWSQELSLNDSIREYIKAWLILKYLQNTEILGIDCSDPFYQFIFDVSIGYDYSGISSPAVCNWLNYIKHPQPLIEELLSELPPNFKNSFNNLTPVPISNSITLSTFHGCPPKEIEAMAKFLMEKMGFNVVIKFNPTLLGYDQVSDILYTQLGYHNLFLDLHNFYSDLQFNDAVNMMKRLQKIAIRQNLEIGAKFTNTLMVQNSEKVFTEPVRYLSGAPLYPLAIRTLFEFRKAFGENLPVSFSGGINKDNFANTLACNILPVTTCTDILKKGGYSRLSQYLFNLHLAMKMKKVRTLKEYILKNDRDYFQSVQDLGLYKLEKLLSETKTSQLYHSDNNTILPKKIKRELGRFDCINCDICLKVCPNLALASFEFKTTSETGYSVVTKNNQFKRVKNEHFHIQEKKQIVVIRDACNSCGNCQTFCPEIGDPQKEKFNFFRYENTFAQSCCDGFYWDSTHSLHTRLDGLISRLHYLKEEGNYKWVCYSGIFVINENNDILQFKSTADKSGESEISIIPFIISKLILKSLSANKNKYPLVLY